MLIMLNKPIIKKHTKTPNLKILILLLQPLRHYHKQQYHSQPLQQMIRRHLATVTAAPRSLTPPPLFCFFLLRVRLLLRWWPRESEGERAVHRPHTHSSFPLCVSPCMDSHPHLTPRSTHIMCPLCICMHTHAGPLVLSFAPHAPLPSCLAAWAEHRNCFFVSVALSGRPLSLSPCVCVLLYGSNESVCAGRPTCCCASPLLGGRPPRFGFCCWYFLSSACVVVECTHLTFFDCWFALTADA
ncbi:hypothetical protein ECC02_012841 [Trypanosoma cruzi]|uniref:Uncharacterized protein n=1 Tax=Trypanosoma cruzi TaxID=5693 RepID=A0A7J6XKS6_TRYCR|nr:hypothetical protein ECC02_012841 [Trypanosoma cruzi]